MSRLRAGIKHALGMTRGRGVTVYPDDRVIASYPKSGNTWVRFLVASLATGRPARFAEIEGVVGDIHATPERRLLHLPRPRLLKSHDCFDPRYGRAVVVVRDPRDVLLSYHRFCLKMGYVPADLDLAGFTDRFLAGSLDDYGSWAQNVGSWRAAWTHDPAIVMVRYEDLLAAPEAQTARIAQALALPDDRESVARAVAASDADAMRASERDDAGQWWVNRGGRADIPFVGRGEAGRWRQDLPDPLGVRVQAAWGGLMAELGYS